MQRCLPCHASISIHALREEGDTSSVSLAAAAFYFYPRPPRGGRPIGVPGASMFKPISIHALREEGDRAAEILDPDHRISIHALREEGDGAASMRFPLRAYFYPRPPRGGRRFVEFFIGKLAEFLSTPSARRATKAQDLKRAIELISIHALREEGDGCAFSGHRSDTISIHALREEGDTAATWHRRPPSNFYPRPPRGGRPGSRPS